VAEKSKAEIAEELRAEYRAAIKRTADEEEGQKRKGLFGRDGVKSIRMAYFFWFLLGGFGAHRFYLGRPLSGAGMLALTIAAGLAATVPLLSILSFVPAGVVFVWWLVDAFTIPRMLP
jgi:TM2 domain-containing membrane protein YozV